MRGAVLQRLEAADLLAELLALLEVIHRHRERRARYAEHLGGEAGAAVNGAIELDSEMPASERSRFSRDLELMRAFSLDGARGRSVAAAFGGNASNDVYRYLDERVNFVLPAGTRIEERVTVTGASFDPRELSAPEQPGVLAQNVGTALWLLREQRNDEALKLLRESSLNWNEAEPMVRVAYALALFRSGARAEAQALVAVLPWDRVLPLRRARLVSLMNEWTKNPAP
jgi:hypothetical protein